MFSRMFRLFFVALFAFCVVPMAALAQDGVNTPDLDEQSGQQLSMFAVTANDLLQNNPVTIQALVDFGFTSQQVEELKSEAAGAAASSSDGISVALQESQQQSSFHCPCSVVLHQT